MNEAKELTEIRAFQATDFNFVISSWLNGLRYGSDWFRIIDKRIYFQLYHEVITKLLQRPNVAILVMCLKDDPDVILGYSVSERREDPGETLLHWVFVKPDWRHIGIAKDLTPEGTTTVTHLTKIGKAILANTDLKFNPFVL